VRKDGAELRLVRRARSQLHLDQIRPHGLAFIFFFNYSQFSENFFGGVGMPDKSLLAQIRDTMLITVFVFIGIEGTSVYSRYAQKRSDVGAATILGFVAVTGLMVAVTLLPYAVAPRAAIAGVANPSLAGALELAAGHWGAVFISVGVLISVLGAFLAWSLICAEVLFAAAQSKDMPRLFSAQNANRVPANALWLTNIIVSLFIISTYWSRDAFNFMLNMTSVTTLLPYLLVAGYGVLLARSGVWLCSTCPAPSSISGRGASSRRVCSRQSN
jgi:arginine:ornithine antiporter/lysine permease